MTAFTAIDLSQLPRPSVVVPLDYETIRQRLLDRFMAQCAARGVDFSAFVESDPAIILLEAAAHEILLDRAQRNDEVNALLLAYAQEGDLEHLAAQYGIRRHDNESDQALRRRVQLAPETWTNAGTEASYIFHALEVSGVTDATADSPEPGQVVITILGEGDPDDLVERTSAHLSSEDIRQLTDQVLVRFATIVNFEIQAQLVLYPGPAADTILGVAQTRLETQLKAVHRLGYDVARSAILAALHVEGVQRVDLITPAHDIVLGAGETALCTGVALTEADTRDV